MNCDYCGDPLKPFTKFCTKCGNPAPPPAQASYTPPPPVKPPPSYQAPPSWGAGAQQAAPYAPRRKSRAGKILLIVFSILVVLGVGAGVAVYFGIKAVKSSVQSSGAYRVADEELKRSSAVAERLGQIRETGFPLGTSKENADGTGHAAFTASVEGTKASGRYVVTLEREGGAWRVTHGFVKLDGSDETINIVGDESGTGAEPAVVDAPPPPPPPKPGVGKNPKPLRISGGVLNGKATSLPQPPYPAVAKAVKAQGTVVVQVEVDEQGQVISASAVSGHPLLRAAAVAAARQARFSPTLLSGKPVKVSGILTYNFKPE